MDVSTPFAAVLKTHITKWHFVGRMIPGRYLPTDGHTLSVNVRSGRDMTTTGRPLGIANLRIVSFQGKWGEEPPLLPHTVHSLLKPQVAC